MEAINDILELDNLFPEYRQTDQSMVHNWERAGGLDALESVQRHPNMEIYKAAGEILTKYYTLEEGANGGQ